MGAAQVSWFRLGHLGLLLLPLAACPKCLTLAECSSAGECGDGGYECVDQVCRRTDGTVGSSSGTVGSGSTSSAPSSSASTASSGGSSSASSESASASAGSSSAATSGASSASAASSSASAGTSASTASSLASSGPQSGSSAVSGGVSSSSTSASSALSSSTSGPASSSSSATPSSSVGASSSGAASSSSAAGGSSSGDPCLGGARDPRCVVALGGAQQPRTNQVYWAPKSTHLNATPEVAIADKAHKMGLMPASGVLLPVGSWVDVGHNITGPPPTVPAGAFTGAPLLVASMVDPHCAFASSPLTELTGPPNMSVNHRGAVVGGGYILLPGLGTDKVELLTRTTVPAWSFSSATASPDNASDAHGATTCVAGEFVVDSGVAGGMGQLTVLAGVTGTPPNASTQASLDNPGTPAFPPVVLRGAGMASAGIFSFRVENGGTTVYRFRWNGSNLTATGTANFASYAMSGAAAVGWNAGTNKDEILVPTRQGTLLALPVDFTSSAAARYIPVGASDNVLGGVITAQLQTGGGLHAILGGSDTKVRAVKVEDGAEQRGFGWPVDLGTGNVVAESPAVVDMGALRWLAVVHENNGNGFIRVFELSPPSQALTDREWPEYQHDSTNSGCMQGL